MSKDGNENILPPAILHDLISIYSQPQRHYHNHTHIERVLAIIDELRSPASDYSALYCAAWFHDVVYDPRVSDNEEKSAIYARTILSNLSIAPETIATVEKMILSTKTHRVSPDDLDTQILLDADLAILGSSPSDYQAYAQGIRREYDWVGDREYCLKRKDVLEKFLERDRIYRTDRLFKRLESSARYNLRSEIESLSSCN